MADAEDSKSSVGNHVRVQVPPSAPSRKHWVFSDFEVGKPKVFLPLTASFDSHPIQKP
jgi:hypothetical protein